MIKINAAINGRRHGRRPGGSDAAGPIVTAGGAAPRRDLERILHRGRIVTSAAAAGQRAVSGEHHAILDAALARNAPLARSLLADHYEATATFRRRDLKERQAASCLPAP